MVKFCFKTIYIDSNLYSGRILVRVLALSVPPEGEQVNIREQVEKKMRNRRTRRRRIMSTSRRRSKK